MGHEHDAIDRDIWLPFVRSYAEFDAPLYVGIHSPDLIRAGGPTAEAYGRDRVADEATTFFARVEADGGRLAIDFRFTERIVGDGVASERGVFRLELALPGREVRVTYSRFHVFERIEAGRWRILADYDSKEGGAVTSADFDAAAPIVRRH